MLREKLFFDVYGSSILSRIFGLLTSNQCIIVHGARSTKKQKVCVEIPAPLGTTTTTMCTGLGCLTISI